MNPPSCTPIGKAQQNGWIKKLGEAFPEDTFTYEGHPRNLGLEYSIVLVKSELFPDDEIRLWKENGKLCTNYHYIAYERHVYTLYLYYIDAQYADDKYEGVRYSKLTDASILDKYKVRFRLSMKDTDHISIIDVDYNDGSDNDHTIVRDIDV